jgi:outer membrane protein OmpA-like peptidoglycan-associated protein
MRLVRKTAVLFVAAAATAMGGCATKGFVRQQASVVDTKLQATQAEVDKNQSQIQSHDQRIAQIDQSSREALQRANDANKLAEGKFTYTTVLADDSVVFGPNRAVLTDEAKMRLGDLATRLKNENRNVYLEIRGYADRRELRRNRRLGDQRAEAVRTFLNMQGVALNRMGAISYGDQQPVALAPSSPAAGASESTTSAPATAAPAAGSNRRAVILVLQ